MKKRSFAGRKLVSMEDFPGPDWPFLAPEPAPVDLDLYTRSTLAKVELVEGYLIDGPDRPEARLRLLALLLRNVGLKAALRLAPREVWQQAMHEAWGS